jgi:hypothetical protein
VGEKGLICGLGKKSPADETRNLSAPLASTELLFGRIESMVCPIWPSPALITEISE